VVAESLINKVFGPGDALALTADGNAAPTLHVEPSVLSLSAAFLRVAMPPTALGGAPTRGGALVRVTASGNIAARGVYGIYLLATADGVNVDGTIALASRRIFVRPGTPGVAVAVPVRYMADLPEGDYHIAARVDGGALTVAPGPTVHVAKGFVQLVASQTDINFPSGRIALAGERTNAVVRVTVTNQGNLPSRAIANVSVWASLQPAHQFSDGFINGVNLPPLVIRPQQTRVFYVRLRQLPFEDDGTYYLTAQLLYNNSADTVDAPPVNLLTVFNDGESFRPVLATGGN